MKSVLVTGGTIRIGKAISDALRGRGWKVIASSHRPDAGANVTADMSLPGAAERLFADAVAIAGGRLDAVVNNAALFMGDPAEVQTVDFDAPKLLVEALAGQGEGAFAAVNLLDARVRGGPYGRAKADLARWTREAAVRLAPTVRVNAVALGPVLPPEGVHEKAGPMLLARRPEPQDVADAVAFLLEAGATTGCVIPVDSGQSIAETRTST